MRLQRRPREEHPEHLKFIATLPCLVTGLHGMSQACHIRFADRKYAKEEPGMQQKPHDFYVVPLSIGEHTAQHRGSERAYWRSKNIDPVIVAALLWCHSQHDYDARIVIEMAQAGLYPFS